MMKKLLSKIKIGSIDQRVFSDFPKASLLPEAEVKARVLASISKIKAVPENVSPSAYFVPDLGFDTFQIKEAYENLSVEFCIPVESIAENVFGIPDAITFLSTHPKAR